MFRFENSEILYLLAILPVLIAGFYIFRFNYNKRLKKYGSLTILQQLMPLRSAFRPALLRIRNQFTIPAGPGAEQNPIQAAHEWCERGCHREYAGSTLP